MLFMIIMRGRQTRVLSKEQMDRLERFRTARHDGAESGYSLPQLTKAMAAPFGYRTVQKALQGLPVWVLHHAYIVSWLDRFVPTLTCPVDDDVVRSQAFREDWYSGRREQTSSGAKNRCRRNPRRN